MTHERRRERAEAVDRRLTEVFVEATGDAQARGMALVAVGGYGRSELSPHSDIDVVLLHDPSLSEQRVREVAEAIWYPLWDEGMPLDHSVRDAVGMREAARDDFRAAIGMLDARAVVGDSAMVLGLRSEVLADWRRDAKKRVAEVRADRDATIERSGWLAHAAVPDLKTSGGGLRDGVIMRALVATWLVDIPRAESEALRSQLLDVRDALHEAAGRRTDRFGPEVIPDAARILGVDPEQLDLSTRDIGRRINHMCRIAWRRIDGVLSPRPDLAGESGPKIQLVAPGVGRLADEIVLTHDADPQADPAVALRGAAVAARAGISLAPGTAAHLAQTMGNLPEPWPATARDAMVGLLTSGPGLVSVWNELDFEGVIDRWLPEWSEIRLRGSSSPVHRFTVDRHSLETCAEAAGLARSVARPDLLAVAALVHDIGKGREGDHSEVGAPMAEVIATRWGFDAADAAMIAKLVRWHLLLPTVAIRRDIEDPATIENVAEIVGDTDTLDLLAALTEADALSASEAAWSTWRAGLIKGLVRKTWARLEGTAVVSDYEGWPQGVPLPDLDGWQARGFSLGAETHPSGSLLTVVTGDRHGLMASLAGAFASSGLDTLSCRTVTIDGVAASMWEVTRADIDVERLRERVRAVLDGEVDLAARLDKPAEGDDEPYVALLEREHQSATMLDIRARDRRGLVWLVCKTIADLGHSIRSAHLSTYGPEARDVFYVVDAEGAQLDQDAAEKLRAAVFDAIS